MNQVIGGGYEIEDLQYADINEDGTINVLDIISLLNHILSQSE